MQKGDWFKDFRFQFVVAAAMAAYGCADGGPGDSDPVCGNSILEMGEACDDGNTASGDGCSSLCIPDNGTLCGNGSQDSGEDCDDGNTVSGDGCDSACALETESECGDNTQSNSEECDDGNVESGDGCSATCNLEPCGNEIREGDEECDDGNVEDDDGCSSTCTLEAGVCGDGVFNSGEQCDDGNKEDGDGCDATCQLEGSVCGNGTMDAGETCDDGNLVNFDGCSNGCQTEECGDGVLQPDEQCEDGNIVSDDGCSSSCQSEGATGCGNGILELAEECDDGNQIGNDGCAADCTDEATGICVDQFSLSCGSSDSWDTSFLGSTNEIDGYSCATSLDESGPEYTYLYFAETTGTVRLELSGMTSDLDLFVIEEDGDCSQDSCIVFGESATEFAAIAGRTYYVVVDGYQGSQGPYSISLNCGECGDNNLDADETCDDGNLISGDGCDEFCQDEGGTCETGFNISCGLSESWSTLNVGATNVLDSYSCSSFDESGPEYAYRFTPTVETTMNITLTPETGVDLDLFILSDDGNGLCESGDCDIYADSTVETVFPAGGEYWIVVDGYQGAAGSYDIDFDCDDGSCVSGTGNNNDSCTDIYLGSDIWRCTTSPNLGNATVSQVCRDVPNDGVGAKWVTFHTNPTDCCACDGEFDAGCCMLNSGSSGCP